MKKLLLLACLAFFALACQSGNSSGNTVSAEEEAQAADSIVVAVDNAIKELEEQSKAVAKEVDDLLNGI